MPRSRWRPPAGSEVAGNPRRYRDTSLLSLTPFLPGPFVALLWQRQNRKLIWMLRKLHLSTELQDVVNVCACVCAGG